ncbi:hypothetical protein MVEN_00233700 [Mycena venus]|uniref:F-box domain-containing protein n=1 Tax=Mycena venus TaxID=2733690 RepID=A0A8H7DB74_9AGAR|nr:hypothetical protein MVEN_00233700 [Mycena venus]
MAVEFPQELVDAILDHLQGDSTALAACSLVARAWVPRCRSHLFERCYLYGSNIRGFGDLLRSSDSCTFIPHVQSIHADRTESHQYSHYFNEIAPDLHHLIHVRTLTLDIALSNSNNSDNADEFFRKGLVAAFPHVTRLVLTCECRAWPAPLIEMVCLFPALQVLHISSIIATLADPPANASPPPGLHSLELTRRAVGPIFAWLHAFNRLCHVDSLKLYILRPPDALVVHETLRQFGGNFHHLDITLTWSGPDSANSVMFDLGPHSNLKTLSIRDFSMGLNPQDFDPTPMLQIIMTLAAPKLEQLSLGIFVLPSYRNLNWASLDAFLSPARFPRLQKVLFSGSRDETQFLRGALPLLEASGVLAVELR